MYKDPLLPYFEFCSLQATQSVITFFLIIICIPLSVLPANAAAWQSTEGPDGGMISGLAVTSHGVFAATRGVGIYSLSDSTSAWLKLGNAPLGNTCLASWGDTLWTGGYGLCRSADQGKNWSLVWGDTRSLSNSVVEAVGYAGRWIFFTASHDRLFRISGDDGRIDTMKKLCPELAHFHGARAFIADRDTLYMGSQSGIVKSSDQGKTWQYLYVSNPETGIYSLLVKDGRLFGGTYRKGVIVSDDHGETWHPLNTGLPSVSWLTAEDIDTLADGSIWVCCGNYGLYKLDPGRNTWTKILTGYIITMASGRAMSWVVDDGIGVRYSGDTGVTWIPAVKGLRSHFITSLSPSTNGLLATSWFGGVYRLGSLWNHVFRDVVAVYNTITEIDRFLFCGTDSGIFRSENQGVSWRPIGARTGLADSIPLESNAFVTLGDTVISASGYGVFTMRSSDTIWRKINSQPLTWMTANKGIIFGCSGRLFRSDDTGRIWTCCLDTIGSFESVTAVGDTVYAINSKRGVFRSYDNGISWVRPAIVTIGFTRAVIFGSCLFAAGSRGVGISQDNGTSFAPLNDGLDFMPTCLAISDSILYAGTIANVFMLQLRGFTPAVIAAYSWKSVHFDNHETGSATMRITTGTLRYGMRKPTAFLPAIDPQGRSIEPVKRFAAPGIRILITQPRD